jgi:curli production assembly/transport component CsgE
MQREKNELSFKGRAVAVCIGMLFAIGSACAQDAETQPPAHADTAAPAQPLISLPSTPTPGPVGSTSALPAANGAPLTSRGTVNAASSLEKGETLADTPRARTADITSQKPLDEQLGGIVTTDTVTLAGQDFYTWFAQAWTAIPLSDRYIVSVHERPSPRYGSLVWVEYGQRRVFQAFLPIARSNVKPVADSAAQIAFNNVMQADLTRLLFHDADMASDEL